MDSFDSLQTTMSSIDLGTTVYEPHAFTSTPVKQSMPVVSTPEKCMEESDRPLPPTLRNTSLDSLMYINQSLDATEHRLRTMSFKRQILRVRLKSLQTKSEKLKSRDHSIIKRHTELRRQRSLLDTDIAQTSLSGASLDEEISRSLRRCRFNRNSLRRKASHRRARRSLPVANTLTTETDAPGPEKQPLVLPIKQGQSGKRSAPRLRKVIQNKIRMFLGK